jgi:hypothetical protein
MSNSKTAVTRTRTAPRNWPPTSVLTPGEGHMWMPKVAFDLHEVIVSFLQQFASFANQVHPDANMKPKTARFYDPGFDPEVNITPVEWQHLFKTFCMLAPGGYGDLPLIPGVIEQMEKIKAAGIGIEIWTWVPGASSVVSDDNTPLHSGVAQRQTIELIKKLGIPVDVDKDVKFVAPNQKARRLGQKHIPLLVEDNRSTAVSVADMAHAAILVPTSYNQVTCPNVLRLKSRDELGDRVVEFFEELRAKDLILEGRR